MVSSGSLKSGAICRWTGISIGVVAIGSMTWSSRRARPFWVSRLLSSAFTAIGAACGSLARE